MLAFLEGPLWYFALAVFAAGSAWRLVGALRVGGGKAAVEDAARGTAGLWRGAAGHLLPRATFLRHGRVQFVLATGLAFHLALFALLLFGAPHVAFLEARLLGFGWQALPEWAFVVVAEIAAGSLLLLWVRRATDPVTRAISRPDDHAAAAMTMAVLLTGCFALGGGNPALRGLHMLSVDLWLIYFPFGSLFHAFTWVLSRGYTGALFARRGIRA